MAQNMTLSPPKFDKIISIEIFPSVSHTNVNFEGDSQLFDHLKYFHNF